MNFGRFKMLVLTLIAVAITFGILGILHLIRSPEVFSSEGLEFAVAFVVSCTFLVIASPKLFWRIRQELEFIFALLIFLLGTILFHSLLMWLHEVSNPTHEPYAAIVGFLLTLAAFSRSRLSALSDVSLEDLSKPE